MKSSKHALVILLLTASCKVQAQTLADPTRPPASLLSPRSAPDGPSGQAASNAPQLQSILIAPHAGGRHIAVIDGQTVRLGDKYKGAVVVRMSESEVVLEAGTARQVLRLYPNVPERR